MTAIQFTKLADDMLNALSVTDFDSACSEMSTFLTDYNALTDWFKWWYDRRTHIFRASKPLNAHASNLAEVGHAKINSVGRRYMSLMEAAREDVSSAIRQETEIRLFEEGLKGGRGMDSNQRRALKYKAEIKQAEAYAAEFETHCQPKKFVRSTGRHRPPEKRRKTAKEVSRKAKSRRRDDAHVVPDDDNEVVVNWQLKKMMNVAKWGQKAGDRTSLKNKCKPFHVALFGAVQNLKKCYGCRNVFTTKHTKPSHD